MSTSARFWNTVAMPSWRAACGSLIRIGRPLDLDLAAIRLMNAAQDLDQGRLAGAVVADDRQHLALEHVDVHVVQGAHVTEALRQTPGLQVGACLASGHVVPRAEGAGQARFPMGAADLPLCEAVFARLASQISVAPSTRSRSYVEHDLAAGADVEIGIAALQLDPGAGRAHEAIT